MCWQKACRSSDSMLIDQLCPQAAEVGGEEEDEEAEEGIGSEPLAAVGVHRGGGLEEEDGDGEEGEGEDDLDAHHHVVLAAEVGLTDLRGGDEEVVVEAGEEEEADGGMSNPLEALAEGVGDLGAIGEAGEGGGD